MLGSNPKHPVLAALLAICLHSNLMGAGAVLARINDIVLSGQRVSEAEIGQLQITRADGSAEAGEAGLALFADDQIQTGDDLVVVIFFTDEVKTTDKELTIFENSRVTIRGPSSLLLALGSLFARLRGLFDIEMGEYVLGAQGTEFKVSRDATGRGDLVVLDGKVATLPSMPNTPSTQQQTGGAGVLQGSRREFTLQFRLNNSCSHAHELSVMTPMDPPWISLLAPEENLLLMGGESRTVDLRLLAEPVGVEAGSYRIGVIIRCLDCTQEPTCRQASESLFEYSLEVLAAPAVDALQKVVLDSTGTPQAQALAESETRAVLDQADSVFLATRPSYPARGWPSHFDTRDDRTEAFRSARYEAIWSRKAEAWEKLGDAYTDWGEETRAVGAYENQVEMAPSADDDPSWMVKWAESWREIGDLSQADSLLRQAAEAGADDAEFHLALGNLFADRAAVARDQDDMLPAKSWLERATQAFSRAAEQAPDGKTTGVALTELAESLNQQGELARLEGSTSRAGQYFEAARRQSARASDAYQDYPYSLLSQGKSLRELAEIEAGSRDVEPLLGDAESNFRRALERHPDLAPGYLQLGLLYEVRGPQYRRQAIDNFTRSVRSHPKYAPPYFELGRTLEQEQPEKASQYFSTYRALERRPFLSGRKAEEANRSVTVTTPRLQGANLDQARMRLSQLGLSLGQVSYVPSRETPGTVLDQSRAPGTALRRGASIDLTLAEPLGKVKVPNLKKQPREEAAAVLERAGLKVGSVREREKGNRAGIVLEQSPKAGKQLDYGEAVDLVVSVPKRKRVKVPNLKGQSEPRAASRLRRAGFTVGVEYEPTCDQAGVVLNQEPSSGTRVTLPVEVRLLVSAAPERAVGVPRLVGLHESDARRVLEQSGLRAGRVQSRENPQPRGAVVSQSPQPGQSLGVGCAVDLVISTGIQLIEVPNLVGMNISEVQNRFRSLAILSGLKLGRVRTQVSRQPEGMILDQSPRPGSQVRRGTAIELLVSQSPQATAPNVVGYTPRQAQEILAEAGLQLGRVNQAVYPNARPGTIVAQTPRAGSRVAPRSPVHVTVAAQPEPRLVTVPNVVGRRGSDAASILKRFGLQARFQGQGDYVARQTPPAGSQAAAGSVVVLVLVIG